MTITRLKNQTPKDHATGTMSVRTYLLQYGYLSVGSLARAFRLRVRNMRQHLADLAADGLVAEDPARGWYAVGDRPGDGGGIGAGIDGGKWRASSAEFTRGWSRWPR